MEKVCPQCERRFAELDEFCPYDGTALAAADGAAPAAAAEPGVDELVGALIDKRYRIERRLGEGGMGVVYLARHVVIEKPVAIKLLKRSVASDHQVVRRFVQEARAASRIGHPNIADVSDFGTTPEGLAYLVMEYVEGNTLGTAIDKRGRLPIADALGIAVQIARALDAAHGKGIVHRDLKPDNIFLVDRAGKKDTVKIVDFGVAKVAPVTGGSTARPRMTRAGMVFGTPEYMAPEQAQGRTDTDHRVDIYALGIILFEMLTGRVPLRKDSIMGTLEAQVAEMPPTLRSVAPDAGITDAIEDAVARCLAKKPDERVASMRELAELVRRAGQESGSVPAVSSPRYAVAPPDASTLVPDAARQAGAPAPAASGDSPDGASSRPRRPSDEPEFAVGAGPLRRFDNVDPDLDDDTAAKPYRHRWTFAAAILATFAIGLFMFVITVPDPETGVRPTILLDAGTAVEPDVNAGSEGRGESAPSAPSALEDGTDSRANGASASAEDVEGAEETVAVTAAGTGTAAAEDNRDSGRAQRQDRGGGAASPAAERADGRRSARAQVGSLAVRLGSGPPRSIVVETRPHGGTLYMPGGSYGGTDGTMVTRPGGTRLQIACSLPGHVVGRVTLDFDGNRDLAICRMRRKPKCVPGVKNPFDDCTPAN